MYVYIYIYICLYNYVYTYIRITINGIMLIIGAQVRRGPGTAPRRPSCP